MFDQNPSHEEIAEFFNAVKKAPDDALMEDAAFAAQIKGITAAFADKNIETVLAGLRGCFLATWAKKGFSTLLDNGPVMCWQDNGKLSQEFSYVDGKKHGTYKCYHRNGKLAVECERTHGVLHGAYRAWHYNGKAASRCTYVNGVIRGPLEIWYCTGEVRATPWFMK